MGEFGVVADAIMDDPIIIDIYSVDFLVTDF